MKGIIKLPMAAILALAATESGAQVQPNIGDALRQVQPVAPPAAPAPALPGIGGEPAIEPPLLALPGGGGTIDVKGIEIVGNRNIDRPPLQALVAEGAGKALTLAQLEALAVRLTKYYRAHGYFVARAYLPAQEVRDGVVTIRVVEGNYGQFRLDNRSLVRDNIVQGMLDDVKRYDVVSLDTLERAMLIINDTPGARVTRADVMPGEKVGTSDFAVDTAPTPRYAGYALLDNYGSVYTGRNRLSFNLDVNSPTGSGDRISLSGLDTDRGGLLNGRLDYSAALAANGLRGDLAASQTHYQLGSTYAPLDAVGRATGVDAALTYPLRRIRSQTIELSLQLSYKDLLDEIRSTDTRTPKNSIAATTGISLHDESSWFGRDGLTQANASVTWGHLHIRDAAALALDEAGPRTEGTYAKVDLGASRITLLPASFTLKLSAAAQLPLASKDLDGSERLGVTGIGGVMAYPSGELIGDRAGDLRLELGRPLPQWGNARTSWTLFADTGSAAPAHPTEGVAGRHLADAGVGFEANLGGGAQLRANLAHRIGGAPLSEPYPLNKLLVQAGWVF
jgi:hemolysin activation/secretion protein